MTSNFLIETCLETGPLTEAEIANTLEATANQPVIRAVISWLEHKIANEHDVLTTRGLDSQARDEAAGAADALKSVRRDLIQFAKAGLKESDVKS